jgi:antitoxin FitA
MGHIQIRNVPPDLHRKLKARAATARMTLSDYLVGELRPIAELPTMAEWVAKEWSGPLYDLEDETAEVIREAREESDRKWSSPTPRRSSTH